MAGRTWIGTSGWTYKSWRGSFYPDRLPERQRLTYLADRLDTAEINGTFYSLQRPTSFQRWFADTPDGFVFAIKGSRYITHLKRLRDVEVALANLLASGVLALGGKLGPLLWQLPPTMPFDPDRLAAFFTLLPRDTEAAATLAERHDGRLADRALTSTDARRPLRHAVEPRHPGFTDPALVTLLREHGIGLVISDAAGQWPRLEQVTADFAYVRLHGAEELYASGYTAAALDDWAERISAWRDRPQVTDVYVYFDNDAKGNAPHDALALRARLAS